MNKIRWGVLGSGNAAGDFVRGLRSLPDAELAAIASRNAASAERFAKIWSVPRVHKSADDLVNDRTIDVIYVATPNHRHKDDGLLCLEAGKPVLCEKPFALNAIEARALIDVARRKRLFCMEAMWMRFLPLMSTLRDLLNGGAIGEIRMMSAELGFPAPYDPTNRFFNPRLGGGAMLDVGIYPLSLAHWLLGRPVHVTAHARVGPSGVDEEAGAILTSSTGALALVSASLRVHLPGEAVIAGTRGQIRIHSPLYRPYRLSISTFSEPETSAQASTSSGWWSAARNNPVLQSVFFRFERVLSPLLADRTRRVIQPFTGNGYNYEAAEVMRCLRLGELESPIMRLDDTVSVMEAMDAIRRHWTPDASPM